MTNLIPERRAADFRHGFERLEPRLLLSASPADGLTQDRPDDLAVAPVPAIEAAVGPAQTSPGAEQQAPAGGQIVTQLYQAAFGRSPDQEGRDFWAGQLEAGMSPGTVAEQFLRSEEFAMTVGDPQMLGDAEYVRQLYQNIGREVDESGAEFWTNQLQTGGLTRAGALLAFAESAQTGDDPQSLVELYEPQSMLFQAREFAGLVDGDPAQWSGPYMDPEPELFTEAAAEFLTIYPRSYIPEEGENVFETLADEELWDALEEIGITLMHPIAFEQAGQIVGRELSPSVDGGFDRISMEIEPLMGEEEDVRQLVEVAAEHDAIIAGDIIPLHTGLGYDFRLAQMGYENYPGIFDMVEVPEDMWDMLPPVEEEWGFEIVTNDEITPFVEQGVVPGRLNVLLGAPGSGDWSGWVATSEVEGVDGETRRWLYAHLFKPEQPMINWMDPTYNGRLTQSGDVVRHVVDLGVPVNRLDATPFIGIEVTEGSEDLETFTTELAIMGTNDLAFTHRKLDGWTWVELNVPAAEYLRYLEHGPDLGYDFVTRAQTVHPLITEDARVLRVAHRNLLDQDIPHSRLIHAMQNHDEIAYQLIPLRTQDQVQYGDETIGGSELADQILSQAQEAVAGEAAPYNALYRPAENGIATTYLGFIAPALGIDPFDATGEEVDTLREAHVLLAHVSAMQPGVFALSQWDLAGSLPLDRSLIQDRIEAGDLRWINRGAVDLMGDAEATESPFGLPEAQSLYPPLPEQLEDPESFASQVGDIIEARKRFGISDATAVDVPELDDQGLFALVMTLPEEVGGVAVTIANYSREEATATVDLAASVPDLEDLSGSFPVAAVSGEEYGTLDGNVLTATLPPLSARTIVIDAEAMPIDETEDEDFTDEPVMFDDEDGEAGEDPMADMPMAANGAGPAAPAGAAAAPVEQRSAVAALLAEADRAA